jgi:hypothetical protein
MFSVETWHHVETPFCDDGGRDYLRGWGGCSTGEALLHECAVALKDVADRYPDRAASGPHPLYVLATYVRGLTDSTLTQEQAEALSVFVRHAWRLDRDQLLTLVRWMELLGDSIQSRKSA